MFLHLDEDTHIHFLLNYQKMIFTSHMLYGLQCVLFHSDKKLKRDGKAKKAQPDHLQHIPYRLREIMKSKEKMKSAASTAKKLKEGEKSFFLSLLHILKQNFFF